MKRLALLVPVTIGLMLSGCGLRPLYGGGGNGAVAKTLGTVEIVPMPGKAGWLMKNALDDRLAAMSSGSAQYRLEIELQDLITGYGLTADNATTRERRSLRARYRLVTADQGTVVLDATAGSDAGIDVVSSEYATIAAEDTALERLTGDVADQIIGRLALYAQRSGGAAEAPR